jgi:serine/threonine protein kinase
MPRSDVLKAELVLDQRIELIRRIGEGGQAEVWEVKEVVEKRILAAKLVVLPAERRNEVSNQVIDAEIKKLSVLSGQFVVIMHYAIYDILPSGEIVVGYTMPLAKGGTLQSNTEYRAKLLKERETLNETMLCIAQGISTIHDASFVHGDIKPSNVLLNPNKRSMWPQVSDLGAAYEAFGIGPAMDPRYAAPERFRDRYSTTYDKQKSDIYSLGMLFFELITGEYAYGEQNFFEWDNERYYRLHADTVVDWARVPESHVGFLETLKRMLSKTWGDRLSIDDIVAKLEEKFSEGQVHTTRGGRKLEVYFKPNTMRWNPTLHLKLGYVKKLFFISSPIPFELAADVKTELLNEFPAHGFTLYVAFGAADIILTTWGLTKRHTVRNILKRFEKYPRTQIEEFASTSVLDRESSTAEEWEKDAPEIIAKNIVAKTANRTEAEIENFLSNTRLVFSQLIGVAQHRAVRLLLKIDASEPMDKEHDLIVRAIREFLNIHYKEADDDETQADENVKTFPYSYRIYAKTTNKRFGDDVKKYFFVEIYGKDIYWCSRGVLGIIRAVAGVSVSPNQYFIYSSYIQFDQEALLESEDGALADILPTYQ